MLWFVVRALDLTTPNRGLLFALLLLCQLIWTDFGGLNYTPLRAYAATFCVLASHSVWARYRSSSSLAVSSVLSVCITLLVSVEQAISVGISLLCFMVLLTLSKHPRWTVAALCVSVTSISTSFFLAWRFGLFISFQGFAFGGYSYPLLPSYSILIALVTYTASGCILYRCLRLRDFGSSNIPLVLAGCALLPVAFGRCDLLHITAATPAFAVGTGSLLAAPRFGRIWVVLAVVGLIVIPFGLRRGDRFWKLVPVIHTVKNDPPLPVTSAEVFVANQFYVSGVELTAADLPCDRTYFSPSFMPVPTQASRLVCLDTGYYQGLVDVITPARILDKIAEMQQRPEAALILEEAPLSVQFPTELSDLESLKRDSASFWVPRARNAPVKYSAIAAYIEGHYAPGPTFANGRMRVWYPNR